MSSPLQPALGYYAASALSPTMLAFSHPAREQQVQAV